MTTKLLKFFKLKKKLKEKKCKASAQLRVKMTFTRKVQTLFK